MSLPTGMLMAGPVRRIESITGTYRSVITTNTETDYSPTKKYIILKRNNYNNKMLCPTCHVSQTPKHLLTKTHQTNLRRAELKKEYEKNRIDANKKVDSHKCLYRCDRGIHKGKFLEDVCKFHPDYIQFLVDNHRHTFPDHFIMALRQCGVDFK